jgi:glycosyltransferase involved in cell wall biosynthesis
MLGYAFYESDNRIRRYAEALVKRGDQVDAIVLRRQGQPAFEVIEGVNVYRIQRRVRNERKPASFLAKMLLFLTRSAWMLARRSLSKQYDVIHVHSVPDFQVLATLVPKALGARVILDIHDIVPEFYKSKFGIEEDSLVFRVLVLIERLSAAYSDHVIISNDIWFTRLTQRSVKPEKCTTIINYPDISIFSSRPRAANNSQEFVLCYPGTLNWHQGVDLAIEAVGQLQNALPRVKFLILGEGPDRDKLATMIRHLGLQDRVAMVGPVPLEKVAETMSGADLGIVPKRNDNFGDEAFSTKIMEFMAMGIPVVVSRTRIDQHYFNDGLVQFFEPGNSCDLATKILALAQGPARCEELRERTKNFIQENNWDVKRLEYFRIVDRLVQGEDPRQEQAKLSPATHYGESK